jgi:hypothetical protein
VARLLRSELSLPKDVYAGISIYLLFALGLNGGVERRHASLATIAAAPGKEVQSSGPNAFTPLLARAELRASSCAAALFGMLSLWR